MIKNDHYNLKLLASQNFSLNKEWIYTPYKYHVQYKPVVTLSSYTMYCNHAFEPNSWKRRVGLSNFSSHLSHFLDLFRITLFSIKRLISFFLEHIPCSSFIIRWNQNDVEITDEYCTYFRWRWSCSTNRLNSRLHFLSCPWPLIGCCNSWNPTQPWAAVMMGG